MDERTAYVAAIHGIAAKAHALEAVPESVSDSRWLAENEPIVLGTSPSVGAFMDWLVSEDGQEPDYGVETWPILAPHVAWYAAYMDVLLNRKRPRRGGIPSA